MASKPAYRWYVDSLQFNWKQTEEVNDCVAEQLNKITEDGHELISVAPVADRTGGICVYVISRKLKDVK